MAKKISPTQIRKIREATGASMLKVKKVLEETAGDEKKTEEILKKEGFEAAAKKRGRTTLEGVIETYIHHSGRVASLVELLCETDFVAKNKLFRDLAHDLALQVASMEAKTAEELEKQEFIKDPSKKVSDLVREVITKTGENIRIGRIHRVELGK